ncbi:beta-ketoacyl-[acyl-carrier-protein] synthase family protein [Streptomyces cinnamoneus]|uniref:Beta-ACP synthase n=1 Tax=Streptomyces cinnamoneus TaxID=53446 RepID=A0A918TAD9_STRCJ|nr:beta-ketoacyl-[acyl-carrier-protein] synthase family protein [Streptomyces cinnamoneus]GHC39186.1 beta-ACP synthase [Streptomyces cinnamoneus]
MRRRLAAVTGIGVVAPGGVGTKDFWELITSGRTATRGITHFDASGFRSRIAAEADFVPEDVGLGPYERTRLDRAAQFALACAREALDDAGLAPGQLPPERMTVSVGTAVGATCTLEEQYVRVSSRGERWAVDPARAVSFLYDALVPGSFAAEVARYAGAEGPAAVISTGCTSGLDAVAHAAALIEDGTADAAVTGATEAPISPITVACFDAIRATSAGNDSPATASRPFDRERDGFVLGEGAAFFVLEELAHARARGVVPYCVIAGRAGRANAFHMTGLRPDGEEMAEAIRVALRQSGLAPEAVDYVNAHGSGTRQNDRHETAAFKKSLGEHAYRVPVSSIKSMIGHSLGAIGAIEIAACALTITHDLVPPTANLRTPDPECDLDYVPLTARRRRVDTALCVGSGFGGFQSAMVLATPEALAA